MKIIKRIISILLYPVTLTLRLSVAIAAFLLSISTSLLSIVSSVFIIMAAIMLLIGSMQNALWLLILAWLVSPIGLPGIAELLLRMLNGLVRTFNNALY